MSTSPAAYRVMRKTWPHLPRLARRRLGRRPAPPTASGPGVLEGVDPAPLVEAIERDGFVVLDRTLPPVTRAALMALARRAPAVAGRSGREVVVVDPEGLEAPRYDLREADLLADPTVGTLAADPTLRGVAEAYLGGAAVTDLVAMWWSVAQPGGPSDEAAQRFHTDRDRLSFLKLFVYLTDVDDDHGPHVYVRGSHRRLPLRLRADRRLSDDEVVDAYGEDALVRIAGPAGTVFLADTSGVHKGQPPVVGHRLVFQLEWSTNLFGAPYTPAPDLGRP